MTSFHFRILWEVGTKGKNRLQICNDFSTFFLGKEFQYIPSEPKTTLKNGLPDSPSFKGLKRRFERDTRKVAHRHRFEDLPSPLLLAVFNHPCEEIQGDVAQGQQAQQALRWRRRRGRAAGQTPGCREGNPLRGRRRQHRRCSGAESELPTNLRLP